MGDPFKLAALFCFLGAIMFLGVAAILLLRLGLDLFSRGAADIAHARQAKAPALQPPTGET